MYRNRSNADASNGIACESCSVTRTEGSKQEYFIGSDYGFGKIIIPLIVEFLIAKSRTTGFTCFARGSEQHLI